MTVVKSRDDVRMSTGGVRTAEDQLQLVTGIRIGAVARRRHLFSVWRTRR